MNEYLERTDSFMASLGLETYRVGGSVRDELLGRRATDADYVVRNASLADVRLALITKGGHYNKSIKPLKLRDGRQAGWRFARKGLGCIEIMLPRTDRSTGPGHRDFEIILDPTLTLADDAIRRDFTFNALYKRVVGHEFGSTLDVVDPTGRGLYDLSHKMINTTYEGSFRDDPLRTLRALRFVSKLDYDLGSNTYAQMLEYANAVDGLTVNKHISGTALDELCKLLMGQNPAKALRLARDTGVLAAILPELRPMIGFEQESRYHDMTTDEHTFKALETAAHVDAPLRVRMALLFHDSGKPETAWRGKDGRLHYYSSPEHGKEDHEVVGKRIARKALKRLNAGNSLRNDVERLIENHMVNVVGKVKPTKVRRARVKFGDDLLRDLYLHRMCDLSGKGRPNMEHLQQIGWLEQVRATAQAEGVPCTVKELPINGHDLIELGYKGPAIGKTLNELLDAVVVQPKVNTREWCLGRAKELRDDSSDKLA